MFALLLYKVIVLFTLLLFFIVVVIHLLVSLTLIYLFGSMSRIHRPLLLLLRATVNVPLFAVDLRFRVVLVSQLILDTVHVLILRGAIAPEFAIVVVSVTVLVNMLDRLVANVLQRLLAQGFCVHSVILLLGRKIVFI